MLVGIVLAHLMSEPTLMGFVPAGAILIVASQLPTALGVAGAGDEGVLGAAVSAVAEPGAWDWRALALAPAAAAFGHLHHSLIDHEHDEYLVLPTYRRPTLIHTRSGNAKHLNELSHTHPLLVHPEDTEAGWV